MTYGNYPDLKGVKKILVVKMRHLGDVLLTTPLLKVLKEAMPQARLDVYLYQESQQMLEGLDFVDAFLPYDRAWKELFWVKRLGKEVHLLRKVRKENYDLVINLTEGDRGALIAGASGSRVRVGYDPQGKGLFGKKGLYTHVVKVCHRPRHVVERHLDVARRLGIFPSQEARSLHFAVPEAARAAVALRVGKEPFILLHPVSRWLFKCPRPRFYADLIPKLPMRVVLTSGPSEREREFVREIIDQVPKGSVVDLSGTTSLKELGALIEQSRALITVDSVPLHLASALQTPVVALFGPSSEIDWGPWNHPRSVVVKSVHPCRPCGLDGCGGSKLADCLDTLRVEQVLEGLKCLSLGEN